MGGWVVQLFFFPSFFAFFFFFFLSPLPPFCCFVLRRGLGRGELVKTAPAFWEPRLGARFTIKPFAIVQRERERD